jgi:alpha-L-fucosidase
MATGRRQFLARASAAGLILGTTGLRVNGVSPEGRETETASNTEPAEEPPPTDIQKAWMGLGFGMFIHFGINTYYDREWSDGTLNPAAYHPTELDTDRWCSTAREAGMKYLVLVAKHHDGFCNWNTKHTTYSVASTPFGRDLLELLANSAQKYGLRLGIYYSLWDAHEKSHDRNEPAYVDFMKAQLQELLTGYGEIVELWFDGFWKKQQSGWKNSDGDWAEPENFIHSWRMEGAYRWQMDHLYRYVKSIQPGCIVMNNATSRYPGVPLHPVDAVSGEKADSGKEYRRVWPWLGKESFFPMQIENTLSTKGNERFPTGNWFWHPWDHSVASREQVRTWLENARARQANLLLNCGPMASGRLRPEDVAVLSSLQNETGRH